ncbi:ABC transporter ATP-binding protein [Portibacter lacus]|uniref:ABC transporter ATP-binding protein n=1 Tax=Portibacter lacus TaxID=1099794 RepID=A0AA37SV09_9BACT|nr:ATP-binding cassette domain-containing protein [Portibacter lacus]GLR18440.1 ABC transporter ATP-binding protein [Portibacter lacus]
MSVLKINNLHKNYGNIHALNGLNLEVEAGQVYGILGPNGSGKTTTLGIILGILEQTSGSFTWFDNKYGDNPRRRIGAILETPNFYPYLDAISNLKIVQRIKKSHNDDLDEILRKINLYERRESKFRTFSLGMKQRLAIGATLIGEPDVVIFDEPTNGLDPQGIAEVRTTLQDIADSGKTVIMASHILDEVEKICSHVAIIKKGNLLATGSVGSILSTDTTVEIGATDMNLLKNILSNISSIKSAIDRPGFIECSVANEDQFENIVKSCIDGGIVPTHIIKRKKRLEEEFLEITKETA